MNNIVFVLSVGFWLFIIFTTFVISTSNKYKASFTWKNYWKANFEIGGAVFFSYILIKILVFATIHIIGGGISK